MLNACVTVYNVGDGQRTQTFVERDFLWGLVTVYSLANLDLKARQNYI